VFSLYLSFVIFCFVEFVRLFFSDRFDSVLCSSRFNSNIELVFHLFPDVFCKEVSPLSMMICFPALVTTFIALMKLLLRLQLLCFLVYLCSSAFIFVGSCLIF